MKNWLKTIYNTTIDFIKGLLKSDKEYKANMERIKQIKSQDFVTKEDFKEYRMLMRKVSNLDKKEMKRLEKKFDNKLKRKLKKKYKYRFRRPVEEFDTTEMNMEEGKMTEAEIEAMALEFNNIKEIDLNNFFLKDNDGIKWVDPEEENYFSVEENEKGYTKKRKVEETFENDMYSYKKVKLDFLYYMNDLSIIDIPEGYEGMELNPQICRQLARDNIDEPTPRIIKWSSVPPELEDEYYSKENVEKLHAYKDKIKKENAEKYGRCNTYEFFVECQEKVKQEKQDKENEKYLKEKKQLEILVKELTKRKEPYVVERRHGYPSLYKNPEDRGKKFKVTIYPERDPDYLDKLVERLEKDIVWEGKRKAEPEIVDKKVKIEEDEQIEKVDPRDEEKNVIDNENKNLLENVKNVEEPAKVCGSDVLPDYDEDHMKNKNLIEFIQPADNIDVPHLEQRPDTFDLQINANVPETSEYIDPEKTKLPNTQNLFMEIEQKPVEQNFLSFQPDYSAVQFAPLPESQHIQTEVPAQEQKHIQLQTNLPFQSNTAYTQNIDNQQPQYQPSFSPNNVFNTQHPELQFSQPDNLSFNPQSFMDPVKQTGVQPFSLDHPPMNVFMSEQKIYEPQQNLTQGYNQQRIEQSGNLPSFLGGQQTKSDWLSFNQGSAGLKNSFSNKKDETIEPDSVFKRTIAKRKR